MAERTTEPLVCRLVACVLTAGLLVSFARPASGADDKAARQEPKARRLTAAFLDLDGSPLAALLEGRLLRNPRASWVERNAIKEIQRERKLQGLTEAAAGPRRVAVGKLLKADLLILLRHSDTPKEHLQLVVCETRRGLRLAVDRVVLTPKVEADVQQLSALVERAITRHGQEIREICAVPPFVSNDLSYENEHLKAAYAKLVEQTARDRPGLLCVELEEARAIAREVGLTGTEIRRPIPLYLLGEFRHEGKGNQRTATLRMRVMRGERLLASRRASKLSPADAAKFVRQTSAELIDQTVGVRKLPPNSKLEAEQLARRAETFHLLGSWDEAAGLAEASLLLDGQQMRMHQVAASSLAARARPDARWSYKKDPDTIVRGIHLHLRALEHYEIYLSSLSHVFERGNGRLDTRVRMAVSWPGMLEKRAVAPNVGPVATELYKQELAIYRRIIRSRSEMGAGDEYWFTWAALRYRPRQEKFDILLEIIRSIQDLPDAERLVRELSLHFDNTVFADTSVLDSPAGRRYLESLAAIDNQHVQRAVGQLRDLIEQDALKKKQPEAAASRPPPTGPQLLRFEPVEYWSDVPLRSRHLKGWIPAGRGVDLVWTSGHELCLMKEPGRLSKTWEAKGLIDSVAYDGRFAWVTESRGRQKPALFVIDPQDEQVWEIDEDDGLPVVPHETLPNPQNRQRLWIEALEPGRALLIAYFGRMTISNVTFDPDRGASIRKLFEARNQMDRTDPEPWRDPHMAFRPRYVLGFQEATDNAKPQRRVLVGGRFEYREDWPLVVEPDTGKATVLEAAVRPIIRPARVARTQEAVFRAKHNSLYRIGLPDLRPQVLLRDVPEGHCVKRGDKFLVFGSKCWQIDPAAGPQQRVRVLAGRVPWSFENFISLVERSAGEDDRPTKDNELHYLQFIFRSNHFGLLAVRRTTRQVRKGHYQTVEDKVFRIVFDE